MLCGILIGIFASLAYGLDSFRSQSSEIFVMNMVFKVSPTLPLEYDCQTLTPVELHVLRPIELCEQLGHGERP